MNVLCIVAHPDDECIGAGGTLRRHVDEGDTVRVVYCTDGVGSREPAVRQPSCSEAQVRRTEFARAMACLGIQTRDMVANYPDQALDTVSLLTIVRGVESVMAMCAPTIIYTHWHGDLNQDHRRVSEAVRIATRNWRGRLLEFEVPETTALALTPFAPTTFSMLTSVQVKAKKDALRCYGSEYRIPPHLRSERQMLQRLEYWGGVAGCAYAEAFTLIREVR